MFINIVKQYKKTCCNSLVADTLLSSIACMMDIDSGYSESGKLKNFNSTYKFRSENLHSAVFNYFSRRKLRENEKMRHAQTMTVNWVVMLLAVIGDSQSDKRIQWVATIIDTASDSVAHLPWFIADQWESSRRWGINADWTRQIAEYRIAAEVRQNICVPKYRQYVGLNVFNCY